MLFSIPDSKTAHSLTYVCFTTTGNNFFGEDIVRVLQEVKSDQRRAAYILMDRIQPKTEQNILLRKGLPLQLTPVCCEIGVFGAYVRYGFFLKGIHHVCLCMECIKNNE